MSKEDPKTKVCHPSPPLHPPNRPLSHPTPPCTRKEKRTKTFTDHRVYVDGGEARHFTAVVALFRLNWDKPMYRVMPPPFRAYWLELEEHRKAQAARMREPMQLIDPFAPPPPRQPREESKKPKKPKLVVVVQCACKHIPSPSPSPSLATSLPRIELPVVRMSERVREVVEVCTLCHAYPAMQTLIDASSSPNPHPPQKALRVTAQTLAPIADTAEALGDEGRAHLVASVTALGFRKAHVEEAAQYASNRHAILGLFCSIMLMFCCASLMNVAHLLRLTAPHSLLRLALPTCPRV